MKFQSRHFLSQRHLRSGFTLVETLVASALGIVLLAGVAILYINGNECFVAMANYQNLDQYSCNTLDSMSRVIRNSTAVTSYTTNQFNLTNTVAGTASIIRYNPTLRVLIVTTITSTNQTSVTNLTGCDSWSYALYNRVPTITSTNITFNAATNASDCKLIQMNWKCSRTYLGAKLNTESVQTAQIVLRNNGQ